MSGAECIYCGAVGTQRFPKDHVNHLTYQVVLSRGNGVWYPLKDGRYFDLDTLRVRTLTEVIGV